MIKMESKTSFSFAVFILLAFELFVPLNFATYYYDFEYEKTEPYDEAIQKQILLAQDEGEVVVTYENTCFTSEMDAAEVARYQKGLMDFQTEQISTLSDAALMKNDPTNQTQQNIQININLADQPIYPIRDIANLLEYDEEERERVANEFNVNKENGLLTREQVRALAAREPGGQDEVAALLGINTGGEIPTPLYEKFKVVLPNGKSVALRDILKVQPQDKETACLLDRSFIHGKVTFQALLNKDLFVGFDQSKTTIASQQHVTSTQTTAALNSYDGSMLIPRMYEKYVTTIGSWTSAEEWVSLAGTASILFSREGVNGLKRKIQDDRDELDRLSKIQAGRIGGDSPQTERLISTQLEASSRIRKNDELMREVDFETIANKWKPIGIALYGAGWMGAARIALSASNQILLSSLVTKDPKLKDNYMQIFVNNNNFLNDFRHATDFFGTGKITDWVSDLMSSGAPTKAFETGHIMFVARDATPEEQFSDSFTSFERAEDSWQVKLDWRGRAENSMFEDIRKGGDYSSFALYSNNLEIGTTIKNNEDFARYYNSLAVLAPLINFLIYRRADMQYLTGPVSTLVRAGTFDFVITRFVDPVRFSKDEVCDEEVVDGFLRDYKIFTTASIIQSATAIVSPNKGLLQILGSGVKAKLLRGMLVDNTGKLTKLGRLSKYEDVTTVKKAEEGLDAARASQTKILDEIRPDLSQAAQLEQAGLGNTEGYRILQKRISDAEGRITDLSKEAEKFEDSIKSLKPEGLEKSTFTFNKMEKSLDNLYKTLVLLDPVQLGKQVIASNGFRYVSLCKDTSYKMLTYQSLKGTDAGTNLKNKFDAISNIDVAKQLNLTSLLGGVGEKVDEKTLTQLLNMRAFMDNPYGQLNPQDLFYIHLDGATQQWFGVYDKLSQQGCFRECHDSKNGYVCADEKGVTYTDKKTGKTIQLSSNPDRGLLNLMMQDLARTLIPNRIISAGLDSTCYENEILEVTPGRLGGRLIITDDSCTTIQCLRQQLKLLKQDVSADLSASVFGDVVAVYTNEGRLTANDGKIRFLRGKSSDGKDNSTIGTEMQAPSLAALEEKKAEELMGNSISIKGDGRVSVKGYITNGDEREEREVGELLTIITERGRIEFDAAGGRLVVALYILAKTQANENIKSIATSITRNVDENGNEIPAIAITNVIPKVGGEADAKELKEALEKVQTDSEGNLGGFQVFETDDKKYTITTDENGQPVLRVLDKNTGEVEEYKITGPLRREGNDIIVPTDKGDFRFNLDMQNGQPTLTAEGPDGFREIAALLAAKGPGGIIAFDPRTGLWYALNGQDIPWNDEFAKRGLSLYNTPDGTRGIPGDNLFAYPRTGGGTNTGSNALSIPSFPTDLLYGTLMLAIIILGVLFVRLRDE